MTLLHKAEPFVIAEVGSNWRNFQDAKNSIALAKQCGADAVKFQAFNHEALYGYPRPVERSEYRGIQDMIAKEYRPTYELPLDWLPKLKEKADACGIEFLCTAFSPELVAEVDPFVEIHKIASSDLSYPQLLDAVRKTGKPVLLSTGASSKTDVDLALELLGKDRVTLLYCNSAYPSTQHNLFQMDWMRETWGIPVGLSDHSLDVVYAPLAAVHFHGACVIEKHFTAIPHEDTPDRGHSLDADAFKIMCDHLRGHTDTIGFNPSREEKDMFLKHNRRLIATSDIEAGDVLAFGKNYGAYRSLVEDSHGLTPFGWNNPQFGPEGKEASKLIKRGESLGPGDFA